MEKSNHFLFEVQIYPGHKNTVKTVFLSKVYSIDGKKNDLQMSLFVLEKRLNLNHIIVIRNR